MAGNKLSVKLQRTKTRSAASVSPARSQLSDDTSNTLPDLSLLRKSIPTSVTGFAQARDVFDTGTSEVKLANLHAKIFNASKFATVLSYTYFILVKTIAVK